MLSRASKAREVDLKIIALVGVISAACYFIPFPRHGIYVIFTIIGAVGLVWVVSMILCMVLRFLRAVNVLLHCLV